jgi:hypothetical protein
VNDKLENFFTFWCGPRLTHRAYDELLAFIAQLCADAPSQGKAAKRRRHPPIILTDGGEAIRGEVLIGLLEALRRDGLRPNIGFHTASYVQALTTGAIAESRSAGQRRAGLARKAEQIEERNSIIGALRADIADHPGRRGWKMRADRVSKSLGLSADRVLRIARRYTNEITD